MGPQITTPPISQGELSMKILIGKDGYCKIKQILLQLSPLLVRRKASHRDCRDVYYAVPETLLKGTSHGANGKPVAHDAVRNTIYEITEKEMKSDHRHELKTNELAEWLGNLPEWTKENLVTIIIVIVVIAVAGALYGWRLYSRNVLLAQEETEFTNLLNQVSNSKMQILQGQQSQGRDFSFVLLQPAKNLQTFAQKTNHKRMAALALIKRAEALRAELHYGNVEKQYLIDQTNLAKASYAEALEKCPTIPSLAGSAKFGMGLCEEELGNFDQARQTYQDIAGNSDFKNTLAITRAKRRLETMADYEQNIVFEPAPKVPESTTRTIPPGTGELPNIIPPFNIYRPLDFDNLNLPKEPAVPETPGGQTNQPVDANVSGK
jgi:predicted negative regulator of RcsB-dependent stress response